MIPLTEMQDDLIATERDIIALANIVGNLDVFIEQAHGEERRTFHIDRMKYDQLLTQAHRLKQQIQSAISDATEKPKPL